jgi:hypothetical protein
VPFQPFTLVSTPEGSVNLCLRTDPLVDRSTCPIGPSVIRNHHDAFATSFFKLLHMWVDAAGVVPAAKYGVARQPCTVS